MSQPDPVAKPRYSAGGTAALLIIGLLILVPSGLCTGIMGVASVADIISHPEAGGYGPGILSASIIVGGPFIAVGATLVWLAIRRMRAH
jgi:hypothetical protein